VATGAVEPQDDRVTLGFSVWDLDRLYTRADA
jgi:hypothetical protein